MSNRPASEYTVHEEVPSENLNLRKGQHMSVFKDDSLCKN